MRLTNIHYAFIVILYCIIALLIAIFSAEIFFRIQNNYDLFSFEDRRIEIMKKNSIKEINSNRVIEYDPILGWKLVENYKSKSLNTIEYGIRKNFPNTTLKQNSILAVGDSFTVGSEVKDYESWPAQLELMLKNSVLNAGVGGYGSDQIILRTTELLDKVNPKHVILSFLNDDILRVKYTIFTHPKPYYFFKNNTLIFNPPNKFINTYEFVGGHYSEFIVSKFKAFFARFYIVDKILGSRYPEFWYNFGEKKIATSEKIDEVEVTCALLKDLQSTLLKKNIKLSLVMQYGGNFVVDNTSQRNNDKHVIECSKNLEINIIDTFKDLKYIAKSDINKFKILYVMRSENSYGHMSKYGNKFIADLIYKSLYNEK